MLFKKLTITGWQQFENIELEFHPRLTVLTGANGSGKTTILNLLARHCGWEKPSLAIPQKNVLSKGWEWFSSLFGDRKNTQENIIGEIRYSNEVKANLIDPQQKTPEYHISIQNAQTVECFYIPSHRSIFRYQQISSIPTQSTINKRQAFDKINGCTKSNYFGGHSQSSSFFMKETLVAWAYFGKGNEFVEPNEQQVEYYKGFENILKIVLPKELGFRKFAIRNYEVILECDSGDFIIDAASGGISAIIDMAWQIYMYSTDKNKSFTVLIDEVENHLHPTMQRRILPDFLKAFPDINFIVATHNPLIVGSSQDSAVYVLKFKERIKDSNPEIKEKKVISQKLDLINKAKTAAEILDEVLGVSFTMPIWAEEKLSGIIGKYAKENITEETFNAMRKELDSIGLERLMPEAIVETLKKQNDTNK